MTQTDLPILADGDLRLRSPRLEDAEARLALGVVPEIQHMFGINPDDCAPMTPVMANNWVTSRMNTPLCWVIDHENRMIGDAFFHTVDTRDRRASLALGILDPNLLGQGLGTRVLHLLAYHAFGAMNLHRIALRVIEYNERAIAAYKKVGFVVEGRERQSARVGNTWHDDIIMGLLAPQYHAAAST
ncbi:GNAT family N-acetyltransferase [Sulfitobacter sp. M57]|uniref:GNAT family N-acetyltransferase n=1 Tax=unclassified Sulfitobacter TaxID=196795 RepID=UPI0023E20A49|nr:MULTISPECIES: GNAT family protein [unclassified Sulfitobacter]MDF3413731.1 GNAT family N-acetyltransferase [Sulfitobacter sp. KE5]MDF3420988.1 GNAT family N-acetyltransferase [Sulfitobacter sp. KE43]MDF3432277.1 GNAT family N-acetyltransferase [Sulfitobacter sp. KE42]MDF3457916.1 GNAT family N-acetyltransferase [Sulfitobacter sp. S74]MDF3461817.1 GNAT family N-acetyltransferase [Sulfitobacter sp. Ks18]